MGLGDIFGKAVDVFNKALDKAVDGVDTVYNTLADVVNDDSEDSRSKHYMKLGDDSWYGRNGKDVDKAKATEYYIDACAVIDLERKGEDADESSQGFSDRIKDPEFVKKSGDMFAEWDGVRKDCDVAMALYAKACRTGSKTAAAAGEALKAKMDAEKRKEENASSKPALTTQTDR